jgi:hypothetical protein
MDLARFAKQSILLALGAVALGLSACGGGGNQNVSSVATASEPSGVEGSPPATSSVIPSAVERLPLSNVVTTTRAGFLGAFFRPIGSPPFGVFQANSPQAAPAPYPSPGSGYCSTTASNGVSIESGDVVDPTKLADIVNLGVGWTRMPAPQFFDDGSHIFGPGHYTFTDFDSAQCNSLVVHGIRPVVGLEAGPVQYNATPGTLSPQSYPIYQSAADFGQWCGVVAAHERAAFPSVTQFSLPGNEVNTNPTLFPGGAAQIAAYSEACYAAIKAANPSAYVYGFELNMDGNVNAPAFVRQMYALGCKVGTCYDGLAIHLSLAYPLPAPTAPCYPNPGGTYSLQCVTDIENAAQAPIHVLISESVYTIPGSVPDEATKALAVVAEFSAYAGNATIDGVSYANVDECALYPTGFFVGGCLISTSGQMLPAYTALQQLSAKSFAP